MFYKENPKKRYFLILLMLSVVSLVLCLGLGLFNTKGEPREAVVALSMLKSGDWVSPVNNGVDIAYKPPFFHWCVAVCSLLQGYVSEFTSRLPSAIAAIAMLLVAYCCMLRSKVGERQALLTSLVTLTAFEVHRGAMACRVDMMLSALVVIAVCLFGRWIATRRKSLVPLIILSMSCAALTKGPVGIILPCGIAGVYMLIRGERFLKAFGVCAAFGLVSCALPAVWYYMAYRQRGDAFLYLVFEENFLRFTGKMVYSSHEEPWFYNVLTILSGYLPYTLLGVMALATVRWRRMRLPGRNGAADRLKSRWNAVRRMPDYELLSLVSVVIIFVFYCIPKSKRSVYLLPLYPFLAYFVTRLLLYIAERHRKLTVGYCHVLATLAVVMTLLVAVLSTGVAGSLLAGSAKTHDFAVSFGEIPAVAAFVWLAAVAVGVKLIFSIRRRVEGGYGVALMAALLPLVAYLSLDALVLPAVYRVKTDYYVAKEIEQAVPQGLIWDYRSDFVPGERNRMHQFTVDFYLNDRIMPLDLNQPESGCMIMGDDDVEEFHKSHPAYVLTELRRFDHKSCDDKRKLTLYSFTRQTKKSE